MRSTQKIEMTVFVCWYSKQSNNPTIMEAFKCTNIIDMNCNFSGINVYHIITNLNNILEYNKNEFEDTVYYQLEYTNLELRKNYMTCKKSMDTYHENLRSVIDYSYDQLNDNLWFYMNSLKINIYYGIREIHKWVTKRIDHTYDNYKQLHVKLDKLFVKFIDVLEKKIFPKLETDIHELMTTVFSQMYNQYNSILFPTFEIKLNDVIQYRFDKIQNKLDLFSTELEYLLVN